MTGIRPFVEHAADVLGRGVEAMCVVALAGMLVVGAVAAAVRWRARG